ncbi:MAG: ferrous iron transport protein A [Acholeplasmataceae bacterium]|nr:ferrous iron transport protein A [Acholeplasmataceae bacterium]
MRKRRYQALPGEIVPLSDLSLRQKGKVTAIDASDSEMRRRFFDMGMTEGVLVTIKKIAPLGDPVDIHLRGYELCLRRDDMRKIMVEVIS